MPDAVFEVVQLALPENYPHRGPTKAVLMNELAIARFQVGMGAFQVIEGDAGIYMVRRVGHDVVNQEFAHA